MLVSDSAAVARLNSPLNLINRLKENGNRKNAMNLFGIGRESKDLIKKEESIIEVKSSFNPFKKIEEKKEEPQIENLIDNHDSQIKLATAHNDALEVLTSAVAMMKLKLDDVKADKLPAVITATSKVVESIRKERAEATKNGKDKVSHYHFYVPEQRKISQYEVLEVG